MTPNPTTKGMSEAEVLAVMDRAAGGLFPFSDALSAQVQSARSTIESTFAEVERLRVQLAGCGVAAMANTRESLERLRAECCDPDVYGYSASFGDCLRACEREIDERERADRAESDRTALLEVVRRLMPYVNPPDDLAGYEQRIAYYATVRETESLLSRITAPEASR